MIVGVLALDQVMGFELMIPGQVFGMANLAAAEPGAAGRNSDSQGSAEYEVRVCGQRSSISTTADWGLVEIRTPYGMDALADAVLVVVPGTHRFLEEPDSQAVSALRAAADNGARIAAMCVGAFTLAAAGLLNGRRATTHWQWAGELARRYPEIDVDPSVLFVDEGPVLTSAGVASGLDLCLHLLRQHAGADLAARTARRVVISAWRDGGQAQYIETPLPQVADTDLFAETMAWVQAHVDEPVTVEELAQRSAMSRRTFARRFAASTGTTPYQWLLRQRLQRAQQLLETTGLSVDAVASRSGFQNAGNLRKHFSPALRTTPQAYRRAFRERREPAPAETLAG